MKPIVYRISIRIKKDYLSLVLFFIFVLNYSAYGQSFPNYRFHTLTPEGGISNEGIKMVKIDKVGFVWIITQSDMFRFDGYNFKSYKNQIKQLNSSMKNINMNSIEEDKNGNLYFSSDWGLFQFNRQNDSFEKLLAVHVKKLTTDPDGNLLFSNENGICLYNNTNNSYKIIQPHVSGRNGNIVFYKNNTDLYAFKDRGIIYKYNKKTSKFIRICVLPILCNPIDLTVSGNNLFALGEEKGLWQINLQTNSVEKAIHFYIDKSNERMPARALYVDRAQNLWIGVQKGLYIYNIVTGRHKIYQHSESNKYTIANNSVGCLYGDTNGNLWIGTFPGNISFVNLNDNARFETVSNPESYLNNKVVSSIAEKGDNIWVGTDGNGLYCYNKETRTSKIFTHYTDKNSLAYDNIKSIVFDHSGKLWIGMFRGGLDCFDPSKNKFINYSYTDSNSRISFNHIKRLALESDSGLWISYVGHDARLTYFSINSTKSENYIFTSKQFPQFSGTVISDFCSDNKGNLWIVSEDQLHIFNVKTKQLRRFYIKNFESKNQNNSLNIQTVYWENTSKSVWIGTNQSDLYRFNPEEKKFYIYKSLHTFDIHSVYSITSDFYKNIWLGTDNGLVKLNTKTNIFSQYKQEDGLQGEIFYQRAALTALTGEVYFGGNNGLSVVNPQNIFTDTTSTSIILSEFFINNKPVLPNTKGSPLVKSISLTDNLKLNHNQTNFGFDFFSSNYLLPNKTRFKYKLNGYDEDWTELDVKQRYASYTNVPPGNYSFEIKCTNADGIWSNSSKIINIRVYPAPWASWWAYFIYTLIIMFIIYAVYYYNLRQKKLQLQLDWETREKKLQAENIDSKIKFFTNISHDFKTPISLILTSLDKLKQDSVPLADKYLTIMGNNAKRLLNLVNELMDFRTIESGQMALKVKPGNVSLYINEITADFSDFAFQKNIEFTIKHDNALSENYYFDPRLLEKVIMNLLNNSFKYTQKGGSINIRTFSDFNDFKPRFTDCYYQDSVIEKENIFLIVISDNGIGIAPDLLAKVCDPFYMVNDPKLAHTTGSGVGLALVKSLVQLHKGYFALFSKINTGSEIVIGIPGLLKCYNQAEVSEVIAASDTNNRKILFEDTPTESLKTENEPSILLNEKKRVLLVEDNEDLRTLVAEFLFDNFEIFEATDGVMASELLDEKDVDLIISDIMMPFKNGIEFCKEVKEDIATSHIPFIMMTARSGVQSHIEGVESGADAYLEKPVDTKLLLSTINNLFNQQQRVRDFYAKRFFTENSELKSNQRENDFIKKLIEIIESKIDNPELDINYLSGELAMSRSKLYAKVKSLTGKSIVEFVRFIRLRRAVKLLSENGLTIQEVMQMVGFESQSYFTRVFKSEFGENPGTFIANLKRKD